MDKNRQKTRTVIQSILTPMLCLVSFYSQPFGWLSHAIAIILGGLFSFVSFFSFFSTNSEKKELREMIEAGWWLIPLELISLISTTFIVWISEWGKAASQILSFICFVFIVQHVCVCVSVVFERKTDQQVKEKEQAKAFGIHTEDIEDAEFEELD